VRERDGSRGEGVGGAGEPRGEDRLVRGGLAGVAARGVGAGADGRGGRGRCALARGTARLPPLPRPAGPPPAVQLPELSRRHTARLGRPNPRHHL
jgi:hypothetical protein